MKVTIPGGKYCLFSVSNLSNKIFYQCGFFHFSAGQGDKTWISGCPYFAGKIEPFKTINDSEKYAVLKCEKCLNEEEIIIVRE